jgi:hypothetical protein
LAIERLSIMAPISDMASGIELPEQNAAIDSVTDNFEAWCIESDSVMQGQALSEVVLW